MVEKEVQDLLLFQMRDTKGFDLFLQSLREQYLKNVRMLASGSCSTMEDVVKRRTCISSIREILEYTGLSKEDVNRWMEIR